MDQKTNDDKFIINCLELIAINCIHSRIQQTTNDMESPVYIDDMNTLYTSFCALLDSYNFKYVDYIDSITSFNRFEKEFIHNDFINYKSHIINLISIV
jgi:hypothetical protein